MIGAEDGNSTHTGPIPRYPSSLLVGRSREQAALRDELAAALQGHGRLVLLGGEAGIGKTSLAQELVSSVSSEAVTPLIGRCYDLMSTPPYGPWRDLFDGYPAAADVPSPPPAFAGGRLEQVTDQAALFAEVRRFFRELSANRPVVILLEDLHWSDPASLELLRNVAAHVRLWPVLLIVTYRADELTRRHPLARQLPALVREAAGLRLDLRRLDRHALRVLVDGRYHLARSDEDRLVAYLEHHAEGNPFFATELLRALQEDGVLHQSDERWVLGDLAEVGVPLFLRQVIEGRVARLGDDVREPLAMAAVIGQEVPLYLWDKVAELDEGKLLAIVEQAVEAHLLEAEQDGAKVRFAHALTREALYEVILPPRRRLWHGKVAQALMSSPQPDPDAVAYHLQHAGDPRAWEWLVKAGDRAQRAYAWLTAAQRLRDATSLLEDITGHERVRGRLLCRIAYLLRFSDPEGAIEAIDSAAAIAVYIDDPILAAETRWVRGLLLCYLDRFQSGLVDMAAGFEALQAMPQEPTRIQSVLQAWFADALPGAVVDRQPGAEQTRTLFTAEGSVVWRGVSHSRFLASAGYLRAAADDCGHLRSRLPALLETTDCSRAFVAFNAHGLGIAQAGLGLPAEAGEAFAQARLEFAALGHHAMVAFTLLNELADVTTTYGAADPAARRQLAAEVEAALSRTGGALRPGVSTGIAWLRCLVLDGRWDDADRMLRDHPVPGNAYLRRELTAARAVLARHRGAAERAWEEIRALLRDGPATEPGDMIHQDGLFLLRLAAELCLDEDDVSAASAWLAAHDRWLAWSESVLGRADGQLVWARHHWASGASTRARLTAAAALALATDPDQPLVRLAAHRLLGEIETDARNHAQAEHHLVAALDLAITCDVPFERALTLLALARLRLVAGEVDQARALVNEIRDICGPLGAVRTLASVDTLAARLNPEPRTPGYHLDLTPREVQILRLLPHGLSNPEIAATLFISPRTVQTHLSNLYKKIEVGGRGEAIAFAVRHGFA